jgi:hypothetical protein
MFPGFNGTFTEDTAGYCTVDLCLHKKPGSKLKPGGTKFYG